MENKNRKQTDSFSIKTNDLYCLGHPTMKVMQTVTNNYFCFTLQGVEQTLQRTRIVGSLTLARHSSPLNLAFGIQY